MSKEKRSAENEIRLLMVNTTRPVFNGQMMFILKYLSAMDRSGMKIGVVTVTEPVPAMRAALEALGATVYALPLRSKRPAAYLASLSRVLRQEPWDIAHVHGSSSTLSLELAAARLAKVPVRIAHSHNTSTRFPVVHRLLKPLMLREANARMACGRDAGRWLFGDLPFEVIPIASDPDQYRFDAAARAATRAALGLAEGDVAVGMVGSFIPVKNHALLLEAFSRARVKNPRLKLVLIGDGPLRGETEQLAQRLGVGDGVAFTGEVPDVPRYMGALDLMALPSLYEGFPNVLVEAQLSGLPTLVSDRVTRDCDMTGLLTYLPLNAGVWTDAMASAKQTDRAKASAEARAKVIARGYDIHSTAARLKARYMELSER